MKALRKRLEPNRQGSWCGQAKWYSMFQSTEQWSDEGGCMWCVTTALLKKKKRRCNHEGIDLYLREMLQQLKKSLHVGDWISRSKWMAPFMRYATTQRGEGGKEGEKPNTAALLGVVGCRQKRQTKQNVSDGWTSGGLTVQWRWWQEMGTLGDVYRVPQLQIIWGFCRWELRLLVACLCLCVCTCVSGEALRDVTLERYCYSVNSNVAHSASVDYWPAADGKKMSFFFSSNIVILKITMFRLFIMELPVCVLQSHDGLENVLPHEKSCLT